MYVHRAPQYIYLSCRAEGMWTIGIIHDQDIFAFNIDLHQHVQRK